jgi:hypothetical protein
MRFFRRDRHDGGNGPHGMTMDLIPPPAPVRERRRCMLADSTVIDAEFEDIPAGAERAGPCEGSRPSQFQRARVATPCAAITPRVAIFERARETVSRMAFGICVIALSATSFWLAGGHALASRLAGPGSLSITDVDTRIVESAGQNILVVSGWIENRTSDEQPVPPLVLQGDPEGPVAQVHSPIGRLPAGGRVSFEGRLAAPSGEAGSIRISFAEAQAAPPLSQ